MDSLKKKKKTEKEVGRDHIRKSQVDGSQMWSISAKCDYIIDVYSLG